MPSIGRRHTQRANNIFLEIFLHYNNKYSSFFHVFRVADSKHTILDTFLKLYHGLSKLHFNEMMWLDMLLHLYTMSWFRAIQVYFVITFYHKRVLTRCVSLLEEMEDAL